MVTNIFYRHINVFLVLRLQHVFKLLHINENETKIIAAVNWAIIISLYIIQGLTILLLGITTVKKTLFDYVVIIMIICFDCNVLYASRLLHLVHTAVKYWVDSIKTSEKLEETVQESYWITMFEVYDEILKVYDIVENIFKTQVIVQGFLKFL